ncbi:NADH kinase pos5 [Geranomyces variabilis]|nr:NADH kinase pos5 [Geranomyces variabilis]
MRPTGLLLLARCRKPPLRPSAPHCPVRRPPAHPQPRCFHHSRHLGTLSLRDLPDRVCHDSPATEPAGNDPAVIALHSALPRFLRWPQPPRTVLIINKPHDEPTRVAFLEVTSWLRETHPSITIIVEPATAAEAGSELLDLVVADNSEDLTRVVDFVITLGGDGTILHTSSLFPTRVPPIISFSLGTLGFLIPFGVGDFRTALQNLIAGPAVPLLHRTRLACAFFRANGLRIVTDGLDTDLQAMNDIVLHRGRHPHLTITECSVDGEFLTGGIADGLIVSTPTGSTAYSLSAGGPLVHPAVSSLILTPICPRSLSFRPALLPPTSTIRLRLSRASRVQADVSVDGRDVHLLGREEYVEVRASRWGIPCVAKGDGGRDWVSGINRTLKWNQSFVNTFREP